MNKVIIIFIILIADFSIAQVPGPAFHPMTAYGANGIHWTEHTLYWENSLETVYNEIYFSADSILVANLDTTVRVKNGYPSNIFSLFQLSEFGSLLLNTKYYWRVVEYNSFGNSISTVWYFKSQPSPAFAYYNEFENGLEGWEIIGPLGLSNWYWSNSSHTGGNPGEIVFRWDPVFFGDSYIMSPEFVAPAGITPSFEFSYFEDWWSDTVVVGCAITTDNGFSWNSIWDLHATGNVGPDQVYQTAEVPGNFRLGFYYTGDSNNIDFFYVDNVWIATPITVYEPPVLLMAVANDSTKKVDLNWIADVGNPLSNGYLIQRKNGLPISSNLYSTIVTLDNNTLTYEDFDVELNQIYTYRIRTLIGAGTYYGNEATAYVPSVVPVELLSFTSSVADNNVILNWVTATETNNSGFQIERRETKNERSQEWKSIEFVNGNGTTTEPQRYSYQDENLPTGKYQYRLKQIDYDGTFEYSNTIEVEINPPAKFSLEQNYPNPFNPSTKISWQTPVDSWQTLKIYDVLGNEVVILINEFKPGGNYDIEFDASKLSSGIYYYQLKVENLVQTKKMILMK